MSMNERAWFRAAARPLGVGALALGIIVVPAWIWTPAPGSRFADPRIPLLMPWFAESTTEFYGHPRLSALLLLALGILTGSSGIKRAVLDGVGAVLVPLLFYLLELAYDMRVEPTSRSMSLVELLIVVVIPAVLIGTGSIVALTIRGIRFLIRRSRSPARPSLVSAEREGR